MCVLNLHFALSQFDGKWSFHNIWPGKGASSERKDEDNSPGFPQQSEESPTEDRAAANTHGQPLGWILSIIKCWIETRNTHQPLSEHLNRWRGLPVRVQAQVRAGRLHGLAVREQVHGGVRRQLPGELRQRGQEPRVRGPPGQTQYR